MNISAGAIKSAVAGSVNGVNTLRVRRVAVPAAETARPAVRGMPGALPAGERLLWQGSPDWRSLRRHAFHVRGLAIYFAFILAVCVGIDLARGMQAGQIAASTLRLAALALVPMGLITLYAWGIARSTIYSVTSRRVVIAYGLVVPTTLNLPFERIEAAGLHGYADGSGDIPMKLIAGEKLAYLLAWPHTRPWRMARTEPMLRCIPGAASAAAILGQAFTARLAELRAGVAENGVGQDNLAAGSVGIGEKVAGGPRGTLPAAENNHLVVQAA